MIPITDRHLREACGLALEQDIAELETQPCSHCFSENFCRSIHQMQAKAGQNRTAGSHLPRTRPLWRLLPAAAMVMLVCLAGYRLLELAPFRMGSSGQSYNEKAEETAGQEAGAAMEDVEEYAMEAETAGEAAPDWDEIPGGIMDEAGDAGETSGHSDMPAGGTGADKERSEEAMPEDAKDQADASSESATSKKETSTDENAGEDESDVKPDCLLLSVSYNASTRILNLELQNDSDNTIILEDGWMLFGPDGDTVNIETDDPDLYNPSRLLPHMTATISCQLPDGALQEGEYTLELDEGKNTLTFSLP